MKFLPRFKTVNWLHLHVKSACQYSYWNAVNFGAAKFQVDVKEGEGVGGPDLNVQLTLSAGGKVNLSTAPNNSFLNFQQIFSFTPLLLENSYSFSHQKKQD